MLKKLLFASAALLAVSCTTKAPQPEPVQEVGPYTVEEIRPNVYHIQDYNTSNPAGESFNEEGEKTHFNNCSDMYLLVGSQSSLLIDLSNYVKWDSTAVQSLQQLVSDRIGETPLTITFTHNHGDHTGMLPAFVDNPSVHFALPRIDFEALTDKVPAGQYSLYDERTFELGGMTLKTLLVPGHTHGSVVFFLEGEDIVFTGDAVGSGHGVWIFNREGFDEYVQAVPTLIKYIEDPANGIDADKLQIYGGHYWQKDWLDLPEGKELDMQYLRDMQTLIDQIGEGTAYSEPSNLNFGALDTYFRLNNSIIVWNAEQAGIYATEKE